MSFLAATFLVACTDPPKPAKATKEDLAKIDKGDDAKTETELGAVPSGPIAKVGAVEIPNEAFSSIYDLKVKKYTDRGREIPTSADRRYRKSIAERLIYHEVLKQEAAALTVEFDAEALAARESQQKRGIRDWDKHLGRRGETEASLKNMYVAELREKAILEKQGKLEVTAEEIDADYEKIKGNWKSDKPRVRASHILVPIGPKKERRPASEKPPEPSAEESAKWEAEAKSKADELYKAVMAEGADFSKIATEKSTGPSAAKGGDIGIFTADRMAEEFSAAAFAMKPGDISKPVKTKFGYHIIKVTGSWGPGELPKDALQDQIVNRLRQRKLHQGRRQLKEDLLGKYEVVDNIKPTLGPEPKRKRPKTRRHGDEDGHGHGGKMKLNPDKGAAARKVIDKELKKAGAEAPAGRGGEAPAEKAAEPAEKKAPAPEKKAG
ncbi:MAG: peptidylprolyl isomerase [Myxococcota bacterium]